VEGKKTESPINKNRYSIIDMKINHNEQVDQNYYNPKNNSKQVIKNKNYQKSNNGSQYIRDFPSA
jgi:hypothetical protein